MVRQVEAAEAAFRSATGAKFETQPPKFANAWAKGPSPIFARRAEHCFDALAFALALLVVVPANAAAGVRTRTAAASTRSLLVTIRPPFSFVRRKFRTPEGRRATQDSVSNVWAPREVAANQASSGGNGGAR